MFSYIDIKYILENLHVTSAVFVFFLVIPLLILKYIKYWETIFSYWEIAGIPHLPGKIPYGSDLEYNKAESFLGQALDKMYKMFPNDQYFGIYNGSTPLLVLRDPETIRLVLAKEFSYFRDRQMIEFDKSDILSQHLFLLDGNKWRALRVKMSPVFTSGKLKSMFPLFVKASEMLENNLLTYADSDINVKDVTQRFSTDVICSCAFGLDVDTINDPESPFGKLARTQRQDSPHQGLYSKLKFMIARYFPFPFITKKRPMRITPKQTEDFMMKLVKDTVEHRVKSGQKRNDFIDLLIQLQNKGDLNEDTNQEDLSTQNIEPVTMTFEVMAAQCFVFFAAGHETSSSVKSYCLYELALHQDIQDRLYKEIEEIIEKHGGITYQAIRDMEYLDMVVNETLRKYPTLQNLTRVCVSPFTFPSGHRIEKGQRVMIPVWSLHHDSDYYPNPDQFDPERFTKENNESRHPFVFIPFGEGPRICIGMRFGLLQVKMGLVTFMRRYRVEPSEKTVIPIAFQGTPNPLTRPKVPIILKLTKRV